MTASDGHGVFTRAGYTQEAGAAEEAVKLEYDGWVRQPDPAESTPAPDPVPPPAQSPATSKTEDPK